MTTCETIRELLPLWAGDDLTDAEQRTVTAHLEACPACAAEAEPWRIDLAIVAAAAGDEAPPALPAGLVDRAVAQALAPRPRVPSPRWRVLQPLAAAAVLAAMLWGGPAPRTEPNDRGLAWSDVQEVFRGCLEQPVPLAEWRAPEGAGVVALLTLSDDRSGYVLTDCLEGDDLAAWRRYPWLTQRIHSLESGGDVLVAVCRDGADDRGRRRRLRRAALTSLRKGL